MSGVVSDDRSRFAGGDLVAVSLKSKIVTEDQAIYRVNSGHGRRFFSLFQEKNMAFLEIPDAGISPETFRNVESARRHVRRARDVADYIRSENTVPNLTLTHRLSDYDGKPDADDRSGNSLFGSVSSLYHNAKVGDLIVSPSAGPFREILYGEITSDFAETDQIDLAEFGGLSVPFRKVKWFKKTERSELLPYELSEYISGRKAVQLIKRQGEALRFLDIAYGSYITQDSSRAVIAAQRYRADNFFETSDLNDLIGFLIAAVRVTLDQSADELSELSIREAIKKYVDRDTLEYFSQNFNSPGASTFKSKLVHLAPAVAILIAIAISGKLASTSKGGSVDVTSDQSIPLADDLCSDLSEIAKSTAEAMGVTRCIEIENLAKEVNKDLGIGAPAAVENTSKGDGP